MSHRHTIAATQQCIEAGWQSLGLPAVTFNLPSPCDAGHTIPVSSSDSCDCSSEEDRSMIVVMQTGSTQSQIE
uniref:hypothetical protein n=1 Tax=Chloroflexus sp. TaxID=1904827 RepID=UPI002ACE9BC7